jgi:hypothetical protein
MFYITFSYIKHLWLKAANKILFSHVKKDSNKEFQGIRGHPKTIKPFQQKSQDEILAKLLGMPTGSSTDCMVGVLSASRGIGVLSALKLTDFCLNNETPIFFYDAKI